MRPSHGRPNGHRPSVCPSVCPSVRYRPRDNPGVGTNGRGEGAHVLGGREQPRQGGRGARTVQRRAHMAWGDTHGKGLAWLQWGQGGRFGGFASSSFLLASSLHDWLTFGFSIQEIS
jgi:hypothetical protein